MVIYYSNQLLQYFLVLIYNLQSENNTKSNTSEIYNKLHK